MNAAVQHRIRFFEGSNVAAAFAAPACFLVVVYFYGWFVKTIAPLEIKIEDVYAYTFNLFAIEIGAMLALFALFACKPTPFLERIKNTIAFAAIVSNTKISLVATALTIALTFVLGLIRLAPDATVTGRTLIFIFWCCLAASVSIIYVRTIRLILTALA